MTPLPQSRPLTGTSRSSRKRMFHRIRDSVLAEIRHDLDPLATAEDGYAIAAALAKNLISEAGARLLEGYRVELCKRMRSLTAEGCWKYHDEIKGEAERYGVASEAYSLVFAAARAFKGEHGPLGVRYRRD
jgi:hypothetical protein